MTLEKWHPFRELESMKREMDRIWEDIFPARRQTEGWRRTPAPEGAAATPLIDIIDTDSEVVVRAEMPGVNKDDIEITLQDSVLTIKGEIKEESGAKEGNYTYSERNYRYFARSLNIPFKVSQDRLKATLKDGLLKVHLPKAAEEQTRKIAVEVS